MAQSNSEPGRVNMSSDTAYGVSDNMDEDEDRIPNYYTEPQRFTEYQIKQHLITKHLLDDDDEEDGAFHSYEYCHFLVATYHSPTPSDWTYEIYLKYLTNSSALDHVHVLFKQPEEIESDGEEYTAVGHVASISDGVEAPEDIPDGNSCGSGGESEPIVIIPCCSEDVRDGKS